MPTLVLSSGWLARAGQQRAQAQRREYGDEADAHVHALEQRPVTALSAKPASMGPAADTPV